MVEDLAVCRATFCNVLVYDHQFVCQAHWRKVPPDMRAGLLKCFRPGHPEDENMAPEYVKAAKEVIRHLARLEGYTPDTSLFDRYDNE